MTPSTRLNLTGASLSRPLRLIAFAFLATALCALSALAQQTTPAVKESTPAPTEKNAAQIELLETKVRFESNGDSRKEVHTRVRINNELGVRQFARLNFDFNRSFQSVEIPLVRITHASGGTADILPSAITDNPNPAVVDYPAYHDVRVKSVRILGLAPDDLLEYRVITSTTHHPLAPDFWLDHTFDRSGLVSEEIFDLDLPDSRKPEIRINPSTPPASTNKSGQGQEARQTFRWQRAAHVPYKSPPNDGPRSDPDVTVSTTSGLSLSIRLDDVLTPNAKPILESASYEESLREASRKERVDPKIIAKALELTSATKTNRAKTKALYDFVAQKLKTVDLPLGSTGFLARRPTDILASAYATPEDKFVLFAALSASLKMSAEAGLTGSCDKTGPARPTAFDHLIVSAYVGRDSVWLDPSLEIAPFGMLAPNSGSCVFIVNREFSFLNSAGHEWESLKIEPPFPSVQHVRVKGAVTDDGILNAKVHYSVRGENELTLRVAFHQAPKEKWKDVAQMLALSDGFRGQITNVTASDPYATEKPFEVEYEISQPKFVDWSKKSVRIPAILPLPGLPDPPTAAQLESKKSIDLGTPLSIDLEATIELPAGAIAQAPIGTTVTRDYAAFSSKYSVQGSVLHASRSYHFLSSELPSSRANDLKAFLHAVQSDQTQLFSITPAPK